MVSIHLPKYSPKSGSITQPGCYKRHYKDHPSMPRMISMKAKNRSCMYRILVALGILLGLCLFLSIISSLSNQNLPIEDTSDHLNAIDKARFSEAMQLKSRLGDQVWQGWGSAKIPTIVWNRSYEFLFNYDGGTPSGWSKITGDNINGEPYFRRVADEPQNFAVRVGDTWTASMATKQTTDVFLIQAFQETLPSPIKQIFPYHFLIQPSETQMGGLLHETFHVYQYQVAPARMAKAESIHKLGDDYESSSESFNAEWKKESALLADALDAKTQEEKIDLVYQFLTARDTRRKDHQLSTELIDYERWLEWEEGTAKYIEVAILKKAGESKNYQPFSEMENDPDFDQYQKINSRWSQELFQLRYQTSSGETQFYTTGMAQAFLLDDLMPDWKEKYWEEGVFLEDLLRLAIAQSH